MAERQKTPQRHLLFEPELVDYLYPGEVGGSIPSRSNIFRRGAVAQLVEQDFWLEFENFKLELDSPSAHLARFRADA